MQKKTAALVGVLLLVGAVYFFSTVSGGPFQGLLSRFGDRVQNSGNGLVDAANSDCVGAKPVVKSLSTTNGAFIAETPFELYSFSIAAEKCPLEFFELGTLRVETSLGGSSSTLFDFQLYKKGADGTSVLVSNSQQLQAYPVLKEGDDTGNGAIIQNVFKSNMYSPFPEWAQHDGDKDGVNQFDLAMILPFDEMLTIPAGESVEFTLMAQARNPKPGDFVSISMVEDQDKYLGALNHLVMEYNNGSFIGFLTRYMAAEYVNPFRPSMLWSGKFEVPHWSGSSDWLGSYGLHLPGLKRILKARVKEPSEVLNSDSVMFSAKNLGKGRSTLVKGDNQLLKFALYADNGPAVLKNISLWVAPFEGAVVGEYWLLEGNTGLKLSSTVVEVDGNWQLLKFEFPAGFDLEPDQPLQLTLMGSVSGAAGDVAAQFAGAQGMVASGDPVGFAGLYPYNVADGFKQGSIEIVDIDQANDKIVEGEQDLLRFLLLPSNEDVLLQSLDIKVHTSSAEDLNLSKDVMLVDDSTGDVYEASIDVENDDQVAVDFSAKPIRLAVGERRTFTLKGTVMGPLSGPSAIYSFLDLVVYATGDDSGANSFWFRQPYEIFIEGRASQTLKYLP